MAGPSKRKNSTPNISSSGKKLKKDLKAPPTIEDVCEEIAKLKLRSGSRHEAMERLAKGFLAGIRLGNGLLGTVAEEAELYRKAEEAASGMLFADSIIDFYVG